MLRVVFMGTPEFSVPTLAEIAAAGHEVVAVYSQPPRPAGRGMAEKRSPVHAFAAAAGLPILTPVTLRTAEAQQAFAALGADVAVVVAYGMILPKPVLDAPRHGCLNLHGSKLPRWRGAAPIQRAIMAGDAETAVMIMRMDEGLDTGPVCLAETIPIDGTMTAGELHDAMKIVGAGLMVRALAALERGSLTTVPQPADGVTYAKKIDKAETRIDFTRPAPAVVDHVRGLAPFPGAWFEIPVDGRRERVKVLRAALAAEIEADPTARPGLTLDDRLTVACGPGAVRLISLQRAGKRPMEADEILRGFPIPAGTELGGH